MSSLTSFGSAGMEGRGYADEAIASPSSTNSSTLVYLTIMAPKTIPIPSILTQKKKSKRKAAREPLVFYKRSKRALPEGPPLSGSLDPNIWMDQHVQFNLFPKEKELFKGMTEEEASNIGYELIARLNTTIKSNEELTLRVVEVEKVIADEKAKAKTLLADVRTTTRQLQRSNNDLKLDLQHSAEKNKELVTERDNLLAEWDSLCGKVPLENPHLDMIKIIVNEELVAMPTVPETPTPVVPFVEHLVVEVIEETEGTNA
ncbi:hypothetical protein LR48_Vigan03g123300 [Vigna angularis]|uniref:Uncharacterized protein n=1 Tax=Phaseolus angularis TaxID=3914 RepID=A0A0L9U4Z0_PHAAN|nr:hypothetical protein LR48_Vigan03g123300 [Vigna angularis]